MVGQRRSSRKVPALSARNVRTSRFAKSVAVLMKGHVKLRRGPATGLNLTFVRHVRENQNDKPVEPTGLRKLNAVSGV